MNREFTADDLQIVDPAAHIRANIRMYLPGGYDSVELMVRLVEECFRLTGGRVSLAARDAWLCVEADEDWLLGREDPFHRLTPLPELGQFSCSLLAALVAFEAELATWTAANGWTVVAGTRPPFDPEPPLGRVVAIRPSTAGDDVPVRRATPSSRM